MKDENAQQKLEAFQQKIEELRSAIEKTEADLANPRHQFILRPDGSTERSVNQMANQELIDHLKQLNTEYERHLEKAPEGYIHDIDEPKEVTDLSNEGEAQQEQQKKLYGFHWLYDPEQERQSNVLAHDVNGLSIAQVERVDEGALPGAPEINTQLLLYNTDTERWEDGGTHEYEDAIAEAEKHALDYEAEHAPDISTNEMDHDHDQDI